MKKMVSGLVLALGLAGGFSGCRADVDPVAPEGALVPPTPYNLVLPSNFPTPVAPPADNPLTVEGVALGRHLFYEKSLSLDNSVACASCHRQELAFTDGRARALGVNQGQSPRSAMSLANLLWEPKLTWDGAASSLESQARVPIEKDVEMHQSLAAGVARLQQLPRYPELFRRAFGNGALTEENTLRALAQFERTLISGNSRFDRFRRGERTALSADETRGLQLFSTHPDGTIRGGNCGDCHSGDLQTNHTFSNNGLDRTFADLGLGAVTGRPTDAGKFRVPSLRNIALTAPYMHDGRFATLEAVLDHYNEHVVLSSPTIDPLMLNTTNDPRQLSTALELTAA